MSTDTTETRWIEARSWVRDTLAFPVAMWALSRLVIVIAMLLIAPALPVPESGDPVAQGWEVFSQWDSKIYETIATQGYEFKNDGKGHSVAFFPLFPILIDALMSLRFSFEEAGTLINNLAFLGALIGLHQWVKEKNGEAIARWTTAALAWCPFSLFGTVIYTEGLFLLCTTLSLREFERERYGWAAVWGAVTTAIRPPGIALVPTFLFLTWKQRREPIGYVTAFVCSAGLLLYMAFCWTEFGEPFAFLLAQRGWQSDDQAFHGAVWFSRIAEFIVGPVNQDEGRLVDIGYPIGMVAIGACALALWRFRDRLGFPKTGYGFCVLVVVLWLVAGSNAINLTMVFGGAYLIWYVRRELSRVALVYAVFSWFIILGTGRTTSAERYAYGVVTLAIAAGILFQKYPRWGYAAMLFFTVLMASLSIRFAQGLWAG